MENIGKEFVPYQEALELKELRFDEPSLGWYTSDGSLIKEYITNKVNKFTLAPTFSQAFRWFREKHKLYHTINMFGDWDKPQYSYLVSGRTMNNPAHMWHFEDKDSHEEAELACLIKLIEIVKQNSN
jgi:hypothetical protein